MHRWLLDLLVCPDCGDGQPLAVPEEHWNGDTVETGILSCAGCGGSWPVVRGIPRFVGQDDDYAGGFGYQWNRWRTIQIDRLAGHTLTEDRLLRDTGWDRGWFAGKLIFDGGAGAGRFSDVMATLGARVVALDLSAAVDACRETTSVHGDTVQCIQASLYAIPLRSGAFDAVHCAGVIQHTPDPDRTMRAMPRLVKPGGRLAYNFYEWTWSRKFQLLRALLRLFTPRLPDRMLLGLCQAMVVPLFPLSRMVSRIRYVRFGLRFLPICATHTPGLSRDQQFEWTLLDTFDWYNPRYDTPQRHRQVGELLEECGLTDVSTAPGVARARRAAGG